MKKRISSVLLRAALTISVAALAGSSIAQGPPGPRPLPNPILYLTSVEPYTANGQSFMRYNYDVFNKDQYPAAMFAPAPGLPPCGANANSSRSWVDFFTSRGQRIYGFCALGSPNAMGRIWFGLPEGQLPSSYVYIEIIDRQTNTRYRSNLADTVM